MFVLVLLWSVPAAAQQDPTAVEDPFSTARFRFGAVAVNPRASVRDIGVDTNVFNTADNKQRDVTFTFVPGTELFLRTGKGLLSVEGELQAVYFNRFETERSINSSARVGYEVRLTRLRPYASFTTINTRQRPGYEIDVRARHYETDVRAGSDLRVASKSTVRVEYRFLDYSFAGDAVFFGRPLNEELNRDLKAVEIGWRQRLTALTTWVTRVSRQSERFEFEDTRNSDSFRVDSGFELGRYALIRGSAFVGFRKLRPADGGTLPGFSGLTADVNVSYTVPTQTRVSAIVDRDVEYSYDRNTPYYIQTGWTAALTQRVIGRWDVQLQGGRDRLSYQSVDVRDQRKDFLGRFGGGVGYTLGDRVRAGFDVVSYYRRSNFSSREYGGIRAGVSVTYGD